MAAKALANRYAVRIEYPPDVVDALAVGVARCFVVGETVEGESVVGGLDGAVTALD